MVDRKGNFFRKYKQFVYRFRFKTKYYIVKLKIIHKKKKFYEIISNKW